MYLNRITKGATMEIMYICKVFGGISTTLCEGWNARNVRNVVYSLGKHRDCKYSNIVF